MNRKPSLINPYFHLFWTHNKIPRHFSIAEVLVGPTIIFQFVARKADFVNWRLKQGNLRSNLASKWWLLPNFDPKSIKTQFLNLTHIFAWFHSNRPKTTFLIFHQMRLKILGYPKSYIFFQNHQEKTVIFCLLLDLGYLNWL